MGILRRTIRNVLTHSWSLERAARLSGRRATIFMLHRFTDSAIGSFGFPVKQLDRHLQWLRAHRYTAMGLGTLVEILRNGQPIPSRSVVFTIDDGYADFHDIAAPVFARYDWPATAFLVTDFIDYRSWLWWDKLAYALLHTTSVSRRLEVRGRPVTLDLKDRASRWSTHSLLVDLFKFVPNEKRSTGIHALLQDLDVDLPSQPGAEYAPLTWDQVRSLAKTGMTFGPHTATHPILALEDASTAAQEITGSWSRLKQEVPDALPVFCYPNGDPSSFGAREEDIVETLGLHASLSTTPGYISSTTSLSSTGGALRALPRFSLESDFARFAQVASGMERFKDFFRPTSWRAGTS